MKKRNKSPSALPFLLILLALAAVLFFAFTIKNIEEKTSATFAEPNNQTDITTPFEKKQSAPKVKKVSSLPDNNPLLFGNPSGATTDASNLSNYLMKKSTYALSYSEKLHTPLWVAWHLSYSDLGKKGRSNNFRSDTTLPSRYYKVTPKDYNFSRYGFDRGHLCPSGDRTRNIDENSETFLMTNMTPQSARCNRGVWKDFEEYCRSLVKSGYELYIVAGPYGSGGTSSKGTFSSIDATSNEGGVVKINVPSHCWKVALVLRDGDDDYFRADTSARTIAVFIPNNDKVLAKAHWQSFLVTVDEVEAKTGLDFFSELEDEAERAAESCLWKE